MHMPIRQKSRVSADFIVTGVMSFMTTTFTYNRRDCYKRAFVIVGNEPGYAGLAATS